MNQIRLNIYSLDRVLNPYIRNQLQTILRVSRKDKKICQQIFQNEARKSSEKGTDEYSTLATVNGIDTQDDFEKNITEKNCSGSKIQTSELQNGTVENFIL